MQTFRFRAQNTQFDSLMAPPVYVGSRVESHRPTSLSRRVNKEFVTRSTSLRVFPAATRQDERFVCLPAGR